MFIIQHIESGLTYNSPTTLNGFSDYVDAQAVCRQLNNLTGMTYYQVVEVI